MLSLRRFALSSWPPLLLAAVAVTAVLLRVQLPLVDLGVYVGYLLVCITLPGTVAWRALLHGPLTDGDRETTWFQDVSLGTVWGFALQLPVYLVGVALGVPLLVWVLPVAAVLTLASRRTRAVWTRPTGRLHPGTAWVLAGTVVYGTVWFAAARIARKPLTMAANRAHVDETFHQALTAELLHHVPPSIPWVAGEPMNYHWFVHAQLAATTWVTGLESRELLRALLPLALMTLTVLALGAAVLHLTGRPAVAAVAPALLVAGGFHAMGPHYGSGTFTEPYLSTRLASSPSFAYGILMSVPVFLLVAEVLRRRGSRDLRTWLALTVALLAAGGAKATVMPVLVCASLGTWALVAVFARRPWNPAAPLTLLVIATTLFTQYVVFGGRNPGLFVTPFEVVDAALRVNGIAHSPLAWTAMLVAMLLGWLLYGAGAVGLLRDRRWTEPAVAWMAIAVVTGITVPFVLYRQGWSILWFSRAVAPLVVVLGAWGLAALLPRPLRPRSAAAYLAVAVASGALALGASTWVESRSATPEGRADLTGLVVTGLIPLAIVAGFAVARLVARLVPGLPRVPLVVPVVMLLGLSLVNPLALLVDRVTGRPGVQPQATQLFAAGGHAAARELHAGSDPDDLVATNAHCMRPKERGCDNRHFWISAHTERRVLIEGWGYTGQTNASAGRDENLFRVPSPFPERLKASDAAFEQPSRETIGHLAEAYGVDWLFVDKRYPVDMPGLRALRGDVVERVHESPHYAVFEILDR